MKTQVKPNETVNRLLYRIFGLDSDELEEEFYRLNPTQTSPFLTAGQIVELPQRKKSSDSSMKSGIPIWM